MRCFAVLTTLSLLAADLFAGSPALADGSISALSVFPVQVRDGASSTGTVTLIPFDANPTTVLVFSSDPNVAQAKKLTTLINVRSRCSTAGISP